MACSAENLRNETPAPQHHALRPANSLVHVPAAPPCQQPFTYSRCGATPLHAAAYCGYAEVVRALVELAGDVRARDAGATPADTWQARKATRRGEVRV